MEAQIISEMKGLIERQYLALQDDDWESVLALEARKREILNEAMAVKDNRDLMAELSQLLIGIRDKVKHELLSVRFQILDLKAKKLNTQRLRTGLYLSSLA